jgi:hypothetical protein
MIKDFSVMINKNISDVGCYRKVPVPIQGAEHIPPTSQEVPQAMMYFIYHYTKTAYDSILIK